MMHMNDEAAILLFDDVVKLKAQQHPKATHADPNARIRLTYVSLIEHPPLRVNEDKSELWSS
jgi:hypothetical protein